MTTFTAFFLGGGASSELDPVEGNNVTENVNRLNDRYFGNNINPLHNWSDGVSAAGAARITLASADYGSDGLLTQDNTTASPPTGDQFEVGFNGNTQRYTFDGSIRYNVVLTYADGTTANAEITLVQTTTGELFLFPDQSTGANNDLLEANPIKSLLLTSYVPGSENTAGLVKADIQDTNFIYDGEITGTSGNDLIDENFEETLTNGSDSVDDGDAVLAGTSGDDDSISAGGGNDTVYAGEGKDTVFGGIGADQLHGGSEDDSIHGESGSDVIYGDGGDDTISAGVGSDTVYGGSGEDSIAGNDGADVIYGDSTSEPGYYSYKGYVYTTGPGYSSFTVPGDPVTITFKDDDGILLSDNTADEQFTDTNQYVIIDGVEYKVMLDTITTYVDNVSGKTYLFGQLDVDLNNNNSAGSSEQAAIKLLLSDEAPPTGTLLSAVPHSNIDLKYPGNLAADDTIFGDGGDDTLYGNEGDDVIDGGADNDSIEGGAGHDHLLGGVGGGADTIKGQSGDDTIEGQGGNDNLDGGYGDDSIDAGIGDDSVLGGSGDDTIDAGAGADSVEGGTGSDSIDGGSENDLIYGDTKDPVGGTSHYLNAYVGTQTIPGIGGEDFTLVAGTFGGDPASSSPATVEFHTGTPSVVRFVDNTGDDVLSNDPNGEAQLSDTDQYIEIDGTLYNVGIDYALRMTDGTIDYEFLVLDVDWEGDGDFNHDTSSAGPEDGAVLIQIAGPTPPLGIQLTAIQITNGAATLSYSATGLNLTADDTIDGGAGQDTIYGQEGDDSISGGADDDQLYGEEGNDTIDGGLGADHIYGGLGDDSIVGGDGDDTLDGGAGNDLLTGGLGNDLFTVGGGNDTITDFGTGETGPLDDRVDATPDDDQANNDFVDLAPYYNWTTYNAAVASGDIDPSIIKNPLEWLRADHTDDGTLNDTAAGWSAGNTLTIQNGGSAVAAGDLVYDRTNVVCFARGTMINTLDGEVRIEELKAGTEVETADHGYQPIRWIGGRRISQAELEMSPSVRPIRIAAGALGKGIPTRDLVVSPQHRILVTSPVVRRMFDHDEILVAAKHLLEVEGVEIVNDVAEVEYWHFLLNDHQVVFSNGARTETLYTGPEALKAVGPEARAEIFHIFPELQNPQVPQHAPARLLVNGRRGRKLAERLSKNNKTLVS